MPGATDRGATVLGRYDAGAVHACLAEAGVLAALERRGFGDFAVEIGPGDSAPPHLRVHGEKDGIRGVLLDTILIESAVPAAFFARHGYAVARPAELVLVSWLREEDMTAAFTASRPPLPLQEHPGLGVLRRAFRVVVRMAAELGKDGVASAPKFFHDAAIFYRSRLFLFLDPREQGRFEALLRDLVALPIGDASLALAGDCVADQAACAGRDRPSPVRWTLNLQVFPVSDLLAGFLHSAEYASRLAAARDAHRFHCDAAALAGVREVVAAARATAAGGGDVRAAAGAGVCAVGA